MIISDFFCAPEYIKSRDKYFLFIVIISLRLNQIECMWGADCWMALFHSTFEYRSTISTIVSGRTRADFRFSKGEQIVCI